MICVWMYVCVGRSIKGWTRNMSTLNTTLLLTLELFWGLNKLVQRLRIFRHCLLVGMKCMIWFVFAHVKMTVVGCVRFWRKHLRLITAPICICLHRENIITGVNHLLIYFALGCVSGIWSLYVGAMGCVLGCVIVCECSIIRYYHHAAGGVSKWGCQAKCRKGCSVHMHQEVCRKLGVLCSCEGCTSGWECVCAWRCWDCSCECQVVDNRLVAIAQTEESQWVAQTMHLLRARVSKLCIALFVTMAALFRLMKLY
jgi:hypothetical protein